MSESDDILDLAPGIGIVTEGVRFELRSSAGSYMGEVNPERVVTIENRSDSAVKRTISDFVLTPSDNAAINPLADRIWPYWRLGNGAEYQLGVLLFGAVANHRHSYGANAYGRLVDQGVILAQETDRDIGFDIGTRFSDALAAVFDMAGIHTYSIAGGSAGTVWSPIAYPAASFTTWASIASDLCQKAGLLDWYFSNTGVLTVIAAPNLTGESAALVYADHEGRIYQGSAIEQTDILDAPNRYKVIDSAARDYPIVATYDLPNDAPNSVFNRSFAITRTFQAPGVGSYDAAAAYAQAIAQTDVRAYETASWAGPPDPRHDTWSVVQYRDRGNMQELSWSLTCAPGGPHQHVARRVYVPA